jgi:hypothetical protein
MIFCNTNLSISPTITITTPQMKWFSGSLWLKWWRLRSLTASTDKDLPDLCPQPFQASPAPALSLLQSQSLLQCLPCPASPQGSAHVLPSLLSLPNSCHSDFNLVTTWRQESSWCHRRGHILSHIGSHTPETLLCSTDLSCKAHLFDD